MKQPAGAVEVAAYFSGSGIDPSTVNSFHPRKPINISHYENDADSPQKVHYFSQRPEVIFLLAHYRLEFGVKWFS